MDEETLTILLRGGHISMPERIARGAWPHPPLTLAEVLSHLTKLIQQHKWFPREYERHQEGQPVHEGGTIESQGPDRYVYRSARAHPIRPRELAQSVERVFSMADDAARHYLKWDLKLPGDLDGWKVIE
jgi:hypothetical protein